MTISKSSSNLRNSASGAGLQDLIELKLTDYRDLPRMTVWYRSR